LNLLGVVNGDQGSIDRSRDFFKAQYDEFSSSFDKLNERYGSLEKIGNEFFELATGEEGRVTELKQQLDRQISSIKQDFNEFTQDYEGIISATLDFVNGAGGDEAARQRTLDRFNAAKDRFNSAVDTFQRKTSFLSFYFDDVGAFINDNLQDPSNSITSGFASFDFVPFADSPIDGNATQDDLAEILAVSSEDTYTALQKQYRLDELFNAKRGRETIKISMGQLFEKLDYNSSTNVIQQLADMVAWVYAHEIAHTLGIPDTYSPFNQNPLFGENLTSTFGNLDVLEAEKAILRYAMEKPKTDLASAEVDAVIAYLRQVQNAGGLNGDNRGYLFAPSDPAFTSGWTQLGNVSDVSDGFSIFEGPLNRSGVQGGLVVPQGAKTLTIDVRSKFGIATDVPPDAFEIALLDAFGNSLIGLSGLTNTDSAFNVQAGGASYASDKIAVSAPADAGDGYPAAHYHTQCV
jgi:hypothetical protein